MSVRAFLFGANIAAGLTLAVLGAQRALASDTKKPNKLAEEKRWGQIKRMFDEDAEVVCYYVDSVYGSAISCVKAN